MATTLRVTVDIEVRVDDEDALQEASVEQAVHRERATLENTGQTVDVLGSEHGGSVPVALARLIGLDLHRPGSFPGCVVRSSSVRTFDSTEAVPSATINGTIAEVDGPSGSILSWTER